MSITHQHLRALVRLRRVDADGADAELRALLEDDRGELAELLAVDLDALPRAEEPSAAAVLLALIERTALNGRDARRAAALAHASALASRVADESMRSLSGVLLPLQHLGELARTPGYDELVFILGGERYGLSRPLLAAVMKELRAAQLGTVMLTPAPRLRIPYRTRGSRGVFDLRLRPPVPSRECVIVDLDTVAPTPPRHPVYSPPNTPIEAPAVSPAYLGFLRGAA